MNKVIEQKSTRDIFVDEQAGVIVISTIEKKPKVVTFDKHKAREVALAICPEIEAELEKAKELLKNVKKVLTIADQYNDINQIGKMFDSDVYEITTFLEGSGNKTK